MGTDNEEVVKKLSGRSWDKSREKLIGLIKELLSVDKSAVVEPSTIYLKFKVRDEPLAAVYAVLWVRSVKNIILGLSTPKKNENEIVMGAPPHMKYTGLTSYIKIDEDVDLPSDLVIWIKNAFENAKNN